MKTSLKRILLICLGSVVLGIAIGGILGRKLPWLTSVFGLELEVVLLGTQFNFPKFGLIAPFCCLMLAIAIMLIGKSWRHAASIKIAFYSWIQVVLWFLVIPACLIFGSFLYNLISDRIPHTIQVIVESFGLSGAVFIGNHEFVSLDGSLVTLVGLCIGTFIFLKFGIQRGLNKAINEIRSVNKTV